LTAGISVSPVLASRSIFRKAVGGIHHLLHTGAVTALTQNSRVSRMFFSVCFSIPSGLRDGERTIGGMTHTTVKNENGARLLMPSALTVEASRSARHYRARDSR
jgi:hypothetical protein